MSKTVEEWKPVVGYEGLYEVSDWGNVRSVDRYVDVFCHFSNVKNIVKVFHKGILKNKHFDHYGYELVNLKANGKHKTEKVHRLIAKAFIPNPENKPCIDHINGNRTDNRAENLRWCTVKENLNYPLARKNISEARKGKQLSEETKQKISEAKFKKPVYQYTRDKVLVRAFPSTQECGRAGYSQSCVSKCCRGELKTHKGYIWSYTPLQ